MEGVQPTLSELQKFVNKPGEIDIHLSKTPKTVTSGQENRAVTHSLTNGDRVQVCEGELKNLRGKIISINGNIITIMPEHEELQDTLEFQASELQKYFKQGDHVRVRYNIIRNL